MTTAPAFHPHPLMILRPGDVTDTWCRHHGRLIPHLYQPGKTPPLVCLMCHPELIPDSRQDAR